MRVVDLQEVRLWMGRQRALGNWRAPLASAVKKFTPFVRPKEGASVDDLIRNAPAIVERGLKGNGRELRHRAAYLYRFKTAIAMWAEREPND